MKLKIKRNIVDILLCGIVIASICGSMMIMKNLNQDKAPVLTEIARKSSVKLSGKNGSCSGVQIITKSGQQYVLSAGHCAHVGDGITVTAETEDGRTLERRIIAEDRLSDLLLIEAIPNYPPIQIAQSQAVGDKVDTFTHGKGLKTYKTSGEIIQFTDIDIPMFPIDNMADHEKCESMPKNRVTMMEIWGMPIEICSMHLAGVVSTAQVVPGSSGGMVVKGDKLIGIVSATDGHFGFFVSLQDIKLFVDNY